MNWFDIFMKTMNDCEDTFTRDLHQGGLLAYLSGWSKSVTLTNERGIATEFDIAVKSYMETFLSKEHDAHDAEQPKTETDPELQRGDNA